ncbi:hypothetical protein HCH_00428 [Hahella chejuensis KCTC 2396]|uniref:Uncharacterized protein n=1 Tax=Hahella chejuensis (strain KCTC 2396) TaxID=349521 RepID=Q2SPT6_HAHCH|nr:hypothetical protein [Hahella chejuensis]ABC27338.1 hypothetical protein HCH_00428 [Hahella chejuensis KCTC 2396]
MAATEDAEAVVEEIEIMKSSTSAPLFFLEGVVPARHGEVEDWWARLGDSLQSEIIAFWQGDADSPLQKTIANVREYLVVSRLHEENEQDAELELDYPNREFYEYLVNHEIYLDVFDKRFHICRAHKAIREKLLLGRLPTDFVCPFMRSECVVRQALERFGGGDIRLRLRKRGEAQK